MIIAYDIGTTTLKIALVEKNGKLHSYKVKKTQNVINEEKAECPSSLYLNFLSEFLKKNDTSEVEAIAVSSNGPSLICTYGKPYIENNLIKVDASNSRLWLDKRGQVKSKEVSAFYGEYIDGSFPLPSILYIKDNESKIYDKTKYFFTCEGFINYALSNQAVVTNSPKGLEKYYWNNESLEHFNLDKSKFPKIIKSSEIVGFIDKNIAKHFNLKDDVKIISGGTDFFVNIIGTAGYEEGVLCDRTGTSEGLNLCCKTKKEIKSLMCYEHPIEGLWNLSGIISTTGAAIDWFRKVIGYEKSSYSYFYDMAKKANKNHTLTFLPYLNGERAPIWDPKAKGVLFGLTLQTKKESIAQAVLEGTGLALKDVIHTMEAHGEKVKKINISVSHAINPYLMQLKSNITNKEIHIVDTSNPELLGLAMLCYTRLGYYQSLIEAIKSMTTIKEIYFPNEKDVEFYNQKYKKYKRLYSLLKDEFY